MDAGSQAEPPRRSEADTRSPLSSRVICPTCHAPVPVPPGHTDPHLTCPQCLSPIPAPGRPGAAPAADDPLIGSTLGGCRIGSHIGEGGMAVVYRAEHLRLQRTVALKVMHPGLLAQDEAAAVRFVTEARIAAQLDHPNIVRVYDVGVEAGHHYIVMQYVDGRSVKDLVREKSRLAVSEAVEILLQVADALDAAHTCGTIHRDIKPSNLLVDRIGVVRLSDFGLGKSLMFAAPVTLSGQVLGTAEYMSPEQCRGEPPDARSDIYSLGVTAFEMLAGRPPFSGEGPLPVMYMHQHHPVPDTLREDAEIPDTLCLVVERMMAKAPDDRYQSARGLIADLRPSPPKEGTPTEPTSPLEHRENFAVAQAVLEVVRDRCPGFPDADAVWDAFIEWRGRGETDYLTRIRTGGRYIFYAVLQDLYDFVEQACGEDLTDAIGEQLSATLLDQHLPDLLQSTLARSGVLQEQISWLVDQFVAGATGEVYHIEPSPGPTERGLCLTIHYRSAHAMADYLRRSGHDPERSFVRSFNVFRGALRTLLARTIHGFAPDQFQSDLQPLSGRFVLALTPENRFHYENMVDILMAYVGQLQKQTEPEASPGLEDSRIHGSPAMQTAWARVRKAAASAETVLLHGESGTGKSHYARVIHDLSARRNGPFVEVGLTADVGSDNLIQSNLFGHVRGAFTGADGEKQGLFALAAGGTIFLDEIGDASPELQAKLLRVIEKKCFKMLGGVQDVSVDVRIIAATNRDLSDLVRQGTFREDLYYRLNVVAILLPPLRSRAEDLPGLAQRLFDRVREEANEPNKHLSDEASGALRAFAWPGNIRELENALRQAVAFSEGNVIRVQDLPESVRGAAALSGADSAGGTATDLIDAEGLKRALAAAPPSSATPTFEWPAHIDFARREYLRVLIAHTHGDLEEIAAHWDRSSENTLLKLIRAFGLEEDLRAARRQRR